MAHYEFDWSESIDDHVPESEIVTHVSYSNGMEHVETEMKETWKNLEEMDRQKLYELGDGVGVELNWTGENADTKEEMIQKLTEAMEEK